MTPIYIFISIAVIVCLPALVPNVRCWINMHFFDDILDPVPDQFGEHRCKRCKKTIKL